MCFYPFFFSSNYVLWRPWNIKRANVRITLLHQSYHYTIQIKINNVVTYNFSTLENAMKSYEVVSCDNSGYQDYELNYIMNLLFYISRRSCQFSFAFPVTILIITEIVQSMLSSMACTSQCWSNNVHTQSELEESLVLSSCTLILIKKIITCNWFL